MEKKTTLKLGEGGLSQIFCGRLSLNGKKKQAENLGGYSTKSKLSVYMLFGKQLKSVQE